MRLCTCLAVVFATQSAACAEDAGAVAEERRDEALARALAYLGTKMKALPDIGGSPRKQFTTACWGLVLVLAQDSKKLRGVVPDGAAELRRVVDYLETYVSEVERRSRDPSQLPSSPGTIDANSIVQYNWPLGMAGIFLSELVDRGILKDEAKALLGRVVVLLRESQMENGGWGHGRINPDGPKGGFGIQGYPTTLVAAADIVAIGYGLGSRVLKVKDKSPIERAAAYFTSAQLDNGNFPYDPSQRSAGGDSTGAGRAAGALYALAAMGVRLDTPTFSKGLGYIRDNLADLSEGHGSAALNLTYGALACHLAQGELWASFRSAFFQKMIDTQQSDGSFECICEGRVFGSTNDSKGLAAGFGGGAFDDGTDAYVTALHSWILLLDVSKPKSTPKPGGAAKATTGGK